MISKISKKQKIFGIILALVIVFSYLILISLPVEVKAELTKNKFVQNFIHSYHSFKKLPDIFFFPYLFGESKLSKFYINVSVQDLITLNEALPSGSSSNPFVDILFKDIKQFVKADFLNGNYKDRVDFRYRGTSAIHWNAYKKSFRINFPDNNLFNGMKSLNFVIPYDRDYQIEILNMYRAKKLGLYVLDASFGRVWLNGRDMGVYLVLEHWSKEWIEKMGLPDSSDIFGLEDWSSDWFSRKELSMFSVDSIPKWKSYLSNDSDMEKLIYLITVVDQFDDEEFKKEIPKILDLDKFYAWDVINVLAYSNHQNNVANLILLFNSETGKFELIPFDVQIGFGEGVYYEDLILSKRILSVPEFKEARDKLLKEYIENEDNLQEDLAFFDNLVAETKSEFFSDSAKLNTNFTYLSTIKKIRGKIIEHFRSARGVLDNNY